MDTMRGFGDQDAGGLGDAPGQADGVESPVSIGTDERRMHVRAYNHWASLLNGGAYPSIEDLEPESLDDFGPHSVLLDFTGGQDNPSIAWLGADLRAECGLEAGIEAISQVPSRSLLSRLTDHYLQIIANRAPIGFEAEFVSQRGLNTLYRGILMPFSSDGDTIDFIYGVINWKELADVDLAAELILEIDQAIRDAPEKALTTPIWADGPNGALIAARPVVAEAPAEAPMPGFSLIDDDDYEDDGEALVDASALPDAPELGDWLHAARQGAEIVKSADGRTRVALYRALGLAYGFSRVAEIRPAEYAELLEDSGIRAQDRAPMTAIVKLVFGTDYEKARLTEFAAALSHGARLGLGATELENFLVAYPGGLKGVVKAERGERAPAPRSNLTDAAMAKLRRMQPQAIIEMPSGEDEFVLLVARRVSTNGLAVLTPVTDRGLIERALRQAAKAAPTG
ncbi:PAS domain-containing protein [Sphingobium boeckii]|uniref:Uncharacterized protein n=1 Tax=Sphingobium boeckii TaxID=1082345 RepID=A0A7W9AF45_9SPHN|nr:hypothetical protein [Sphingobium boeckii]MBB5684433.1 hypothetical protein [Sphingobium boeckii]